MVLFSIIYQTIINVERTAFKENIKKSHLSLTSCRNMYVPICIYEHGSIILDRLRTYVLMYVYVEIHTKQRHAANGRVFMIFFLIGKLLHLDYSAAAMVPPSFDQYILTLISLGFSYFLHDWHTTKITKAHSFISIDHNGETLQYTPIKIISIAERMVIFIFSIPS